MIELASGHRREPPEDGRHVGPGGAGTGRVPPALRDFMRSMRRFAPLYASLPVRTEATCPTCRQVVPAEFERRGCQVVLSYRCPRCPPHAEAHHDAIWTELASDVPGSAERTYQGSRIHPVLRRLPRTVQTLCPDCGAILVGRYFVQDGAVHVEKCCPEHGHFRDCVNSDALLYSKAAWWTYQEPAGQQCPQVRGGQHCPSDCGLCNQHLSGSVLAQVDLTSRCNLSCPVCFANAAVAGRVHESTYEQVLAQLRALREMKPTPCTAIQFTGGEPTVHPRFLDIVAAAREMGFSHIQAATNGLKLADADFARRCAEAGLHTLYLQFDGVGEEVHRRTRNHPGIWRKKLAAVENCRRTGMKVCLVPTVLRGVNDDQVGEVFRFAVAHADVVSAISYQPVSFSGRIDARERAARRYTLGDLAHDIAAASSARPLRDMFPLSIVTPLSQILQALSGRPKITPSAHPDCAFGTYFLISPDGRAYPFPEVIDVEGMFVEMNRIARRIERRGRANWLERWRTVRMFKRHFHARSAPPGLTVKRFMRSLMGMVDKSIGRGEGERLTYRTLLCAGMHFQDRYNFDVERAKRCVILYSTPLGVFPFCTWNCGPEYRRFLQGESPAAAGQEARPAEASPAPQRAAAEGAGQ